MTARPFTDDDASMYLAESAFHANGERRRKQRLHEAKENEKKQEGNGHADHARANSDESPRDGAMADPRVSPARKTARKFSRATMHQLLDVLAEDPALCALVRYDEMKRRVVIASARPWEVAPSPYWTDADTTSLRVYIERRYMLTSSKDHAWDAIHTHAERNRFHPLRGWLESLEWDGVKRLGRRQ